MIATDLPMMKSSKYSHFIKRKDWFSLPWSGKVEKLFGNSIPSGLQPFPLRNPSKPAITSVQIAETAKVIKEEFNPDLMVAIGGGGFYPARVLRTYLKVPSKVDPAKLRNIPIQAIGLSLYEGEYPVQILQYSRHDVSIELLRRKKRRGGREFQNSTRPDYCIALQEDCLLLCPYCSLLLHFSHYLGDRLKRIPLQN